MSRKIPFILLFPVFLFISLPSLAQTKTKLSFLSPGAKYLWPTNASHDITSTFGETRPNHFHAGLDIKTWDRRGYKVFATRNGILYRVRTGPIGYGNVVYLKHKDGTISVYAHLEDFVPKIRHLVDSLRMVHYQFSIDAFVSKYDIRFKQGQVLGYTGSSGIGPPHLHFELRTPTESPFNPFDTNLKVQDHIPPHFVALSVEPLDKNSLVEGRKQIFTRRVRIVHHHYTFGTIYVRGPVGLGINVYDRADHVHNEFAVYQLWLKHGNQVYFHSKVDSFSYKNTGQLNLDRVYPLIRRTGQGFQRLFLEDGNTLTFYLKTRDRGIINLKPGSYTFTILAADHFNNVSKATVHLVVRPSDNLVRTVHERLSAEPKLVEANYETNASQSWFWSQNWFSPASNIKTLEMVPMHKGDPSAEIFEHIHPGTGISLRSKYPLVLKWAGDKEVIMHRIYPERASTISSPDSLLSVSFPRHATYDTLSVFIDHHERYGLPVIQVAPYDQPLHYEITANYHLNAEQAEKKGLAFYSYNRHDGQFEYELSSRHGSDLTGRFGQFGNYYVLQDTIPPRISHPRIYKKSDGMWVASVYVKDNLSDIAFAKAKFYCNGIRGIAEYDPYSHHIVYYRPHFKPRKINKLYVIVYDRVGNRSTARFTVEK